MNLKTINTLLYWCAGLLLIAGSSCKSYKNIPYFQGIDRSAASKQKVENFSPFVVQPGDILSIAVTSRNPEAWTDNKDPGYLVDKEGNIQVQYIGNLKVIGLTITDIQDQLKQKLLTYLKEPTVNIRVTNFKVAVLGDVTRPDVYKVQTDRVTILEALSMAGDLTITGVRNNVLLIRESEGTRQYINIDLTSPDVFRSPYYYLKNNDVIYVQPDKTKAGSEDRSYKTASIILSVISLIAIIYSATKN